MFSRGFPCINGKKPCNRTNEKSSFRAARRHFSLVDWITVNKNAMEGYLRMIRNAQGIFAESLKKLLKKKGLDHITIKDIVEDCGVSRQTFYYHFNDIYQIVEWVYTKIASESVTNSRDIDTWQQGYCRVHERMREDKLLFISACRSIRREYLETFMYNVIYDVIFPVGRTEWLLIKRIRNLLHIFIVLPLWQWIWIGCRTV